MIYTVSKIKRKTTKRKRTFSKDEKRFYSLHVKDAIIKRIKTHKRRFDIDYEKGIYDLTPKEADVYDDSINDILRIIRKM